MTPHTLPGRSSTLHQKVTFAKCSRGCFISTGLRWARSSSSLLHCGVSEVCIRIGCSQERIVLQALHGSSCLHSPVTKRLKIFTNHTEWGGKGAPQSNPSQKAGPAQPQRAVVTLQMPSRMEIPQPLLQCLPTLVVEVCLICNPFHVLKPVSLAGLPLVIHTVCFPLLHSPH